MPRKLQQILALDGIRGIAILAVMAFHFSSSFEHGNSRLDHGILSLASHGGRGVDLFFVLSGFLITRILLYSRESGNYFRAFYMRRVLRIFPVYYLYVLAIFFLVLATHPASLQGIHAWTYVVYLSNWKPEAGLHDPHMTHIWSLAVEEQFYLVWPMVVLLCTRRRLIQVSIAVCALALVARIAATGHIPMPVLWRMTPFRADALAAGAITGVIFESEQSWKWIKRYAIPTGCGVFLLYLVLRNNAYGHAVQFSAVVVACSAAVFLAARYDPRFLKWPILATVGKYSYAMYVFHLIVGWLIWPRLAALQSVIPFTVVMWSFPFIASAATFALAALSYRYYETPFLRLKERFEPRDRAGVQPLSRQDEKLQPETAA